MDDFPTSVFYSLVLFNFSIFSIAMCACVCMHVHVCLCMLVSLPYPSLYSAFSLNLLNCEYFYQKTLIFFKNAILNSCVIFHDTNLLYLFGLAISHLVVSKSQSTSSTFLRYAPKYRIITESKGITILWVLYRL